MDSVWSFFHMWNSFLFKMFLVNMNVHGWWCVPACEQEFHILKSSENLLISPFRIVGWWNRISLNFVSLNCKSQSNRHIQHLYCLNFAATIISNDSLRYDALFHITSSSTIHFFEMFTQPTSQCYTVTLKNSIVFNATQGNFLSSPNKCIPKKIT